MTVKCPEKDRDRIGRCDKERGDKNEHGHSSQDREQSNGNRSDRPERDTAIDAVAEISTVTATAVMMIVW